MRTAIIPKTEAVAMITFFIFDISFSLSFCEVFSSLKSGYQIGDDASMDLPYSLRVVSYIFVRLDGFCRSGIS